MDLSEIAEVFAYNHGLVINQEKPQVPLRVTYFGTAASVLLVERVVYDNMVECAVQVLDNPPSNNDKEMEFVVARGCIVDYISLLEKASRLGSGTHPLSKNLLTRLRLSLKNYSFSGKYISHSFTDFDRHGVSFLLRDLYPSANERMIRP